MHPRRLRVLMAGPATASATTPSARPTYLSRTTYRPRPRVTTARTQAPVSSANPVAIAAEVTGFATSTPTPTRSTSVAAKPAASTTNAGGKLAELVGLVVGAAVLLGVGGPAGLYFTRHRQGTDGGRRRG